MECAGGGLAGVNQFPGAIHTRESPLLNHYQTTLRQLLPSQVHKGHVGRSGPLLTPR